MVVVEIGHESNKNTLGEIVFLPALSIEYQGMVVAKNDTVSAIETPANVPRLIEFTLKNTGSGGLTLSGVAPVAVTAGAFSVTQPSGSTIAPGGSLPFALTFTPPATETYAATVTVTSNDPAGAFTFTISAAGIEPHPAITILNGTAETPQDGAVNMGEVVLSGTVDITVKNTGYAPLTITSEGIAISGAAAAAFSLVSLPDASIPAGGSSLFRLLYTPSAMGLQSASISIPNNDPLRNSARFTIKGTGSFPPPASISAAADSPGSITLTWSAVNGALSYTVYRAASSDGAYTAIGTGTAVSYSNTGLAAASTYYYKVSAHCAYGESPLSSAASAITLPESPTGVSAEALSASSIQIRWNAVQGASSYTVYRAASSDGAYTAVGTSTAASYTNTGLSALSTYYYKVSAQGKSGESVQSASTSAVTWIGAPEGVSAEVLSLSSIEITWNAVNGASSYTLYRAASSGGTYTSIGTSTLTSYTNTGLTAGTTYYYKVSAHGVNGEGGRSAYISATTWPEAPTGVSATAVSFSSIRITWNAVTGASSYTVYRSASPDGAYALVGTSPTASYTDTGLTGSTTYYYQISASNAAKESGRSSTVSAATPAAPLLAPPTEFGVIPVSSGIRLFWNAVEGASGYKVYRASSAAGAYSSIAANVTGTTYLDIVSGSTVYYYKVATINSDGVAGSLSAYNYSPGPGVLTAVPYNSSPDAYNPDTITANAEKYYLLPVSRYSRIYIRWADASDGGSYFTPTLQGDVVVSACREDTGEIIFLNHDNGYSIYTSFETEGSNIILYVVGKVSGSFAVRFDIY
jgi:fibronectin type 3 domain-containing protein